ncbi:MAG: nucleoside hydrolase, partial [Thermoguttaceae bacterium]|nr:nucleoside hydrolase [Thermoguttaceae bacterium]
MKSAFFVLLIGVCVSLTAYAAEGDLLDVRDSQDSPVKLIFDTDIGGDIDDAFALGLIHSLADRGRCELLGVTLTTASEWAAKFVAAENAVYGRPDIPIGLPEKGTDY